MFSFSFWNRLKIFAKIVSSNIGASSYVQASLVLRRSQAYNSLPKKLIKFGILTNRFLVKLLNDHLRLLFNDNDILIVELYRLFILNLK